MPYYCTVPRCTSMAGKAKNVSFHQFPRDEELAKLWNDILKRGKPYTKYSKVCSLHFKPEDYTITSVGKNKGQWRTLRKDAIPSQNLPTDIPAPYHRRQSGSWTPNNIPAIDPQFHQQIAQAIYMQTMIAMQAAGVTDPVNHTTTCNDTQPHEDPQPSEPSSSSESTQDLSPDPTSYRCTKCSKCFKDPDVYILHKRTHTESRTEKENLDLNIKTEMLKSNPILANLLKNGGERNVFDSNFERHLMVVASMESYIRNLKDLDRHCDLDESLESNLVIDES